MTAKSGERVQPGLPLGDLPPQQISPAGRYTRCLCGREVRPGQQCGWCGRRPRTLREARREGGEL